MATPTLCPPRLIVGLGNPGNDYAATRHNIGFRFLDALAQKMKLVLQPQSRFNAKIASANGVWLMQPMTFMNASGQAVAALANFYKLAPAEILIIHDELDLQPGALRIKQGGSNGGHNGLKSIEQQLGSHDFWRIRLGVGHPRSLGLPNSVVDFVLHPARAEDETLSDHAMQEALNASPDWMAGNYAAAQRRLHSLP